MEDINRLTPQDMLMSVIEHILILSTPNNGLIAVHRPSGPAYS